jgi:hypothetical protein
VKFTFFLQFALGGHLVQIHITQKCFVLILAYFFLELLQEEDPPFLYKFVYKLDISVYVFEIAGEGLYEGDLFFGEVGTLPTDVFEFDAAASVD